ncbi:hypothetical protein [Flavobacterium sp.]|uniref:hypothetical protein n=1 Tax=Flavobacterium sp. TaxID=239 RepID=UPI001B6CB919|nr:hypothetical protein [Flavobacterium sp.]MBP6128091.1 hypothetical protein [Flavobacterium sp.]
MKKIVFIITLFIAINSFGQINAEKNNGLKITNQAAVSENDTIIKVYYENQLENNIKPAYFVNDKLVNESVLKTLNPNEIDNVKVEKEDIEIDNVKYYGKILVETKSTYSPNFISLNNLKTKYTNIKEHKIIFKIDNEIVNENYNNFIVDEKYILKIIVENYENKEEKLKVCFVNLITKSEENIKKSKEILLRGKDEFEINKN